MTDLSKLAAGLSDAQRSILLHCDPERWAPVADLMNLCLSGLAECHNNHNTVYLTPLGQSLAAYLKDNNHG